MHDERTMQAAPTNAGKPLCICHLENGFDNFSCFFVSFFKKLKHFRFCRGLSFLRVGRPPQQLRWLTIQRFSPRF